MEENSYNVDEYIVVSIDLLGAKSLIEIGDGLQTIHSVYDLVIEDLNKQKGIKQINIEPLGVRIFSDNIVIYANLKNFDNLEYMFFGIIAMVSLIQEKFLERNILVRGGITIGDFFVDDVMVWGKALVKAYKLESECAIFPRVIIDPCVFDRIQLLKQKSDEINSDSVNVPDFLFMDRDGFTSVNYLVVNYAPINYYFNGETILPFKGLFSEQNGISKIKVFMNNNDTKMQEFYYDDKLMQKLVWHHNYLLKVIEYLEKNDPTHITMSIKPLEVNDANNER